MIAHLCQQMIHLLGILRLVNAIQNPMLWSLLLGGQTGVSKSGMWAWLSRNKCLEKPCMIKKYQVVLFLTKLIIYLIHPGLWHRHRVVLTIDKLLFSALPGFASKKLQSRILEPGFACFVFACCFGFSCSNLLDGHFRNFSLGLEPIHCQMSQTLWCIK